MKLSGPAIRDFLNRPPSDVHVVLLYGPDHGLVRQRALDLQKHHLGGEPGPFSQTVLGDADLKADPARLQDAFCARSLDGGKQVLRLKTQADLAAKTVSPLLEALQEKTLFPAALLLIEAGDLSPRSKLRQAIEKARSGAVALPCYFPGAADLRQMAEEAVRAENLSFALGALDLLLDRLAQNSAMADRELEKLMLYARSSDEGAITREDVAAIVIQAQDQGLDDFAFAVAAQNAAEADRLMRNALEGGKEPVALLRALQRHFMRLSEALAACDQGQSVESAMQNLRPKVFYQQKQMFAAQLRRRSGPACRHANALCLAAERDIKSGGAPAANLIARLVFRLTAKAS